MHNADTECTVGGREEAKGQRRIVMFKYFSSGFAGGAVVESPPADTGDMGSCPGLGRSHVPRSGWAREPWPLSLCVRSLCSATGEATTVRGPRTAKKKQKKNEASGYDDSAFSDKIEAQNILLIFIYG